MSVYQRVNPNGKSPSTEDGHSYVNLPESTHNPILRAHWTWVATGSQLVSSHADDRVDLKTLRIDCVTKDGNNVKEGVAKQG